jgi:hypothetical protein
MALTASICKSGKFLSHEEIEVPYPSPLLKLDILEIQINY